ncbi:TIGR02147 family protein [Halobacteriovorax sp. RT-1-4]|uniref:TIGR02147 family protein n=1 Tax=unclassified Halobacteriovorax TaxID=2639665 RepID=UPI0039996FA3
MQNEIIERLSIEFANARAKNPSYSLRAYANRLGIQVSALSEILNGKRAITKKMGQNILSGLGVNPIESEKILSGTKAKEESNLSLDYFKAISDWYYFAILSLAEIPNFKAQPEWISKRLNISRREAKFALDRLIKLEMLVENKDGSFEASGIQYKTPTDILNVSLKNHTVQTLELAMNSVLNDPIEERDFSTVTMAIDPSKIDEAKKMIKSFRKRLSKKLETGSKKEVYKLSVQLFPLSRKRKEIENE